MALNTGRPINNQQHSNRTMDAQQPEQPKHDVDTAKSTLDKNHDALKLIVQTQDPRQALLALIGLTLTTSKLNIPEQSRKVAINQTLQDIASKLGMLPDFVTPQMLPTIVFSAYSKVNLPETLEELQQPHLIPSFVMTKLMAGQIRDSIQNEWHQLVRVKGDNESILLNLQKDLRESCGLTLNLATSNNGNASMYPQPSMGNPYGYPQQPQGYYPQQPAFQQNPSHITPFPAVHHINAQYRKGEEE